MIEGSGSRARSGSIPLTNGSGSWRPINVWIRIRDSYPDPQHWLFFNLAESGQQEGNAETEDLVMVQTPLSSLRLNNDVLVERVKDIEGKYNSILEMSEKLR
jgi:hypothetical protein